MPSPYTKKDFPPIVNTQNFVCVSGNFFFTLCTAGVVYSLYFVGKRVHTPLYRIDYLCIWAYRIVATYYKEVHMSVRLWNFKDGGS